MAKRTLPKNGRYFGSSGTLLTLLIPALALCLASAGFADVSGRVVDESNNPIAGARVHLQASPDAPVVVTAPDGSFTVPIADPGTARIGASVIYDPNNPVNYATNAVVVPNPSVGVEIQLPTIPGANPAYDPPAVNQSCAFCHAEITAEWQTSVHSTATLDFFVRDLFSGDATPGGSNGFVYIDTHDPDDTGTCATCHAPLADAFDPGNTFLNEIVANGDPAEIEGVSCLACHQIHDVSGDVNGIHTLGNSEYRFPDGAPSTDRFVWGPLDDTDTSFMRASYAPFFRTSEMCASCHQYQAPFGQETYSEWLASPYAVPGPGFRSCQDCHMVAREGEGTVCDLGDPPVRPSSQRHQHTFVGSTPQTLADNIDLTLAVDQEDGRVLVRAEVNNFGAGHSFPTGVSVRNAFLLIEATVNGQPIEQVAGPTVPEWASDDVPGIQEGDYGGAPGTGFAKILEGRINGQGDPVWPVLFVDAETVREKSTIPSGATDVTEIEFAVPGAANLGDSLQVSARLLYRRVFRALQITKGWTETPQGGPIEIEVAAQSVDTTVTTVGGGPAVPEIPALGPFGVVLLGLGLVAVAVRRLNA
ncbi:MAG: carboxypeptidase regulatory-like domain-containing protein [Acidobacteriota bacterium]